MARRSSAKKGKTRTSMRDRARQAAETRERGGGLETLQNLPQGIEFWSPKAGRGNKGKNRFSIVPYLISYNKHPFQEVNEPWYECTFWQHKIGTGTDSKRFICPNKTKQAKDKACPICEYRAALLKSGQDPELAEELKPKQRQMFNILDHSDEGKGIQLFEISPHLFGFMLDDEDRAQSEEDYEGRFFGDGNDGLMIIARFSEQKFGSGTYIECDRIDFDFRDDLEDELITEEAVDLDSVLKILDYDTLHTKFFEIDSEEDPEDEPEEEEDKPSRSSRRSRREEPEDEPEEKPSRSRRSRRNEPEPEEEEPEPEDDNECPFGHHFGYDCEQTKECDDCGSEYDDCRDRLDEIEAEEKKKSSKSSRRR